MPKPSIALIDWSSVGWRRKTKPQRRTVPYVEVLLRLITRRKLK